MTAIAIGLEQRNPFAYMLLTVILLPPVIYIIMSVIDGN